MGVKCLGQEHNTMSPAGALTRTAQSGDERAHHREAGLDRVQLTSFRGRYILNQPKLSQAVTGTIKFY